MRKKTVLIVISCIFFLFSVCWFVYLQFGRAPYVNSALTNSHSDGYEMTLSITVNTLVIFDKENLAKQLVRQVIRNDFDNMLFSYDTLGYPTELTLIVYKNESMKELNKPAFTAHFTQDSPCQYNIIDHSDKFKIWLE